MANPTPTLTIDFKGLCAFVADDSDPTKVKYVDVLMMAAEKTVKEPALCRHDPVLIFRDEDFQRAGERTRHISFQAHFPELDPNDRDQDIGIWDLRGERLTLEGEQLPTGGLVLDPTFQEILSLGQLTGGDERVRPSWVNGHNVPGVASRLRIDHGVLRGGPHVTSAWGLAEQGDWPTVWPTFRQSARWEVYAQPKNHFLHLSSGKKEWIQLRPQAHVLISNLCPLDQPGAGPDVDVLAYYAMAVKKVKPDDRLVFYRKPASIAPPPPGAHPTKPTLAACPPLRAYA